MRKRAGCVEALDAGRERVADERASIRWLVSLRRSRHRSRRSKEDGIFGERLDEEVGRSENEELGGSLHPLKLR